MFQKLHFPISLTIFLLNISLLLKLPPHSSFPAPRILTEKISFSVYGTLLNINSSFLPNISVTLSLPILNATYSNYSDNEGNFLFSGPILNQSLILEGTVLVSDLQGIYASKSLQITLYLGNEFLFDLGDIVLMELNQTAVNVTVHGVIYSNQAGKEPVQGALAIVQTCNEGNYSDIPAVLNGSGYLMEIVNVSSFEENTSFQMGYVVESNSSGMFDFSLANVSMRVEYIVNLVVVKKYYNEQKLNFTLVNTSEYSISLTMSPLSTNGNITGRLLDNYQVPIKDAYLYCSCSDKFEYKTENLEISSEGYFKFFLWDIIMTIEEMNCSILFESKGFSSKQLSNLTLYRTENYSKNLQDVVLTHLTGEGKVFGTVFNEFGQEIEGLSVKLIVNSSLNGTFMNIFNSTSLSQENGSFSFSFTLDLYSQFSVSLTIVNENYKTFQNSFPLNELNGYLKNLENITLKSKLVKGKISGFLYDNVFNISLSYVSVFIQDYGRNETILTMTDSNGYFFVPILCEKILNYSYNLTIKSEYLETLNLPIILSKNNSFLFNESILVERKNITMVLEGYTSHNSCNISSTINIMNQNTKSIIILANTSNEQGYFIITKSLYYGIYYEVSLNISLEGYKTKYLYIKMSPENNYTANFSEITLFKIYNKTILKGFCLQNSSTQAPLNNAQIFVYMNEELVNNIVVYRNRTRNSGNFTFRISDADKKSDYALMMIKKAGFQEKKLKVFLKNSEIDIGTVFMNKN